MKYAGKKRPGSLSGRFGDGGVIHWAYRCPQHAPTRLIRDPVVRTSGQPREGGDGNKYLTIVMLVNGWDVSGMGASRGIAPFVARFFTSAELQLDPWKGRTPTLDCEPEMAEGYPLFEAYARQALPGRGGHRSRSRTAPTSCIRTLAAALSRAGTVCEFEVPLGVGNILPF